MEVVKEAINWLSSPEILFALSTLFCLFCLKMRFLWTTKAGIIYLVGFVVFFVASFQDPNFRIIVTKPDNVPIVLLFVFVGFFMWLSLKQAHENDELIEAGGEPREKTEYQEKVLTWPHLVYTELICLVLMTVGLLLWSILIDAPLEEPANPGKTPNPSKAPWYFLGLQEMLVYYDAWIAGVLLPTLVIVGLMAIPYMDRNTKGSGYYTLKERPFAITIFLFGFIVLWVVLIIIGTFLRGPNWNFYGPYEYWDSHKLEALVNVNLSEFIYVKWMGTGLPQFWLTREIWGFLIVGAFFLIPPPLLARTFFKDFYKQLGFARYSVMVVFFLFMLSLPAKMLLRWFFNLKYLVTIPENFFNI